MFNKETAWSVGKPYALQTNNYHWFYREKYNKLYLHNRILHTCPLSSIWLLVNLSLSNDTTCFNHCPPDAGESGWMWTLGGDIGSDFPATTQLELYHSIYKWKYV